MAHTDVATAVVNGSLKPLLEVRVRMPQVHVFAYNIGVNYHAHCMMISAGITRYGSTLYIGIA